MADEVSANREESRERSNANLRPWQPGQSGNPSGRPKKLLVDKSLESLLLADDSKLAKRIAQVLVEKALEDPRTAQLIVERTEGKPTQKVEHTGEDGGPIQGEFVIRFVKPDGGQ